MADNITEFPKSDLPDNPMRVTDRRWNYCQHERIVIDGHDRTVQCADPKCGATLNAFDYLLHNAEQISAAWGIHDRVKAEAREVAERVSKLKKEEKRLRAMIKRLQEKSESVVTVRRK